MPNGNDWPSSIKRKKNEKGSAALFEGEATTSFRRYEKGRSATEHRKAVPCAPAFLRALAVRLARTTFRLPSALKWTSGVYREATSAPADGNIPATPMFPQLPRRYFKSLKDIIEEMGRLQREPELFPTRAHANRFWSQVVPELSKLLEYIEGTEKLVNESAQLERQRRAAKAVEYQEIYDTRIRPILTCQRCIGSVVVAHVKRTWRGGFQEGTPSATFHWVIAGDGTRTSDDCLDCLDTQVATRIYGRELKTTCWWCRKSCIVRRGRPSRPLLLRKLATWRGWFRNSAKKSFPRPAYTIRQRVPTTAAMILRRMRFMYASIRRRYQNEHKDKLRKRSKDPYLLANSTGENYYHLAHLPNHIVHHQLRHRHRDLYTPAKAVGHTQSLESLSTTVRRFQGRLFHEDKFYIQYSEIFRRLRFVRERRR